MLVAVSYQIISVFVGFSWRRLEALHLCTYFFNTLLHCRSSADFDNLDVVDQLRAVVCVKDGDRDDDG